MGTFRLLGTIGGPAWTRGPITPRDGVLGLYGLVQPRKRLVAFGRKNSGGPTEPSLFNHPDDNIFNGLISPG